MAKQTILSDKTIGERVLKRVFPSGLTVYVVRKPHFSKSYATVGIRYGSVDTRARANGRMKRLPDGVAHFLEHKIFEMPEGDAFDLFAAKGASANAFTSFSSTRYLFGTTAAYAANLRTLLDMVFELHVTDENVEKEKGIIGQEIAMYDDDPDWRLYFGSLGALYAKNPVRIDIAGTKETIAPITPGMLRAIHRCYYHPKNMVLSAVSPEPESTTFKVVQECVEKRSFGPPPPPRSVPPREARKAPRTSWRVKLPISRPRLVLAFKDPPPLRSGQTLLRREMTSALALDCLFGNSGSIYLALYEKGLVDENFSYSYVVNRGYSFGMVGGETDDPAKLRRNLDAELKRALDDGLTRKECDRVRNKALGDFARVFNAPESIAQMLVGHHLRGTVFGDYRKMLFKITRAELNRRLRELLDPAVRSYGVALPR
jgi:predicted Zn-dependent peptidase